MTTYPVKLGGARDVTALSQSLVNWADTAFALDYRTHMIANAYKNVTAADFEAAGIPVGDGTLMVQMMADFTALAGTPVWQKVMAYVDAVRDLGR